jgi:hypothetical protein
LIENPSIKRASGLIISITGGKDLSLFEVDEAATRIREEADPDANIIVGASFDEGLEGIVRVSVVATGIDNPDPTCQTQPAESLLTELAGRLRNDGSQRPATPKGGRQTRIRNMRAMRLRRASIRTAAPLLREILSMKTFSISRPSCAARPVERTQLGSEARAKCGTVDREKAELLHASERIARS